MTLESVLGVQTVLCVILTLSKCLPTIKFNIQKSSHMLKTIKKLLILKKRRRLLTHILWNKLQRWKSYFREREVSEVHLKYRNRFLMRNQFNWPLAIRQRFLIGETEIMIFSTRKSLSTQFILCHSVALLATSRPTLMKRLRTSGSKQKEYIKIMANLCKLLLYCDYCL